MSNIARDAEAYLASTQISEIILEMMMKSYYAGEQGVDPRDFLEREQFFMDKSAEEILKICGQFLAS